MNIVKNIYYYFQSFFEWFTFRRKASYISLSELDNSEGYESIIFNENTPQTIDR
jgi:hypothetical protein